MAPHVWSRCHRSPRSIRTVEGSRDMALQLHIAVRWRSGCERVQHPFASAAIASTCSEKMPNEKWRDGTVARMLGRIEPTAARGAFTNRDQRQPKCFKDKCLELRGVVWTRRAPEHLPVRYFFWQQEFICVSFWNERS
jgi:hypothetical protein